MDDNSIMPFGKYKGEKLANIPANYLIYIYSAGWIRGEIKEYIKENYEEILTEARDKINNQ